MKYEYLQRVVEACPVEFYLSANDGVRVHWPYRIQPVHEATKRYQKDADRYIVDSSFNNPDITNRDTLDKAAELDADIVVLEDVYHDHEATIEKLNEGREMAQEHRFEGTVMYPLQSPYFECWKAVGQPDTIAIGGMKDKPAFEKIAAAKELRKQVGSGVWIHGLGWGATDTLINAVRENPDLLDSIDAQTPFATENNKKVWPGKERMSPVSIRSLANLVEACRRMSPELTDNPNYEDDENDEKHQQTTLIGGK